MNETNPSEKQSNLLTKNEDNEIIDRQQMPKKNLSRHPRSSNCRGRATPQEERASERDITQERVPLREQSLIGIHQEPGYVYRLVKDKDNQIARFEKAGYEKVSVPVLDGKRRTKDASQIGSIAAQQMGQGEEGYYMRIKEEWYNADQEAKQKDLDEQTKALAPRTIKDSAKLGDRNKFKGSIKMESAFYDESEIDDLDN